MAVLIFVNFWSVVVILLVLERADSVLDLLDVALIVPSSLSENYACLLREGENSSTALTILKNGVPLETESGNIIPSTIQLGEYWNTTEIDKEWDLLATLDERWEDLPQQELHPNSNVNLTGAFSFFIIAGNVRFVVISKKELIDVTVTRNGVVSEDGTQEMPGGTVCSIATCKNNSRKAKDPGEKDIHRNNWNHILISDKNITLNNKQLCSIRDYNISIRLETNHTGKLLYKKIVYPVYKTNSEKSALNFTVKYSRCLSIFVSQCPVCKMEFTLMCSEKTISKTVEGEDQEKWRKVKIISDFKKHPDDKNCTVSVKSYKDDSVTNTSGWVIDKNVRSCHRAAPYREVLPKAVTNRNNNDEISCQTVSLDKQAILTVNSTKRGILHCPENAFGKDCSFKCSNFTHGCDSGIACDTLGCYLGSNVVSNLATNSTENSITVTWKYNHYLPYSFNITYKAQKKMNCQKNEKDEDHYVETNVQDLRYVIPELKPYTEYTLVINSTNGFFAETKRQDTQPLRNFSKEEFKDIHTTVAPFLNESIMEIFPDFPECSKLNGVLSYQKTYICNSQCCKNDAPQNVTYFNKTNVTGTFTKKPYSNYTVKLYALREVDRTSEALVGEYSYIYPGKIPTEELKVISTLVASLLNGSIMEMFPDFPECSKLNGALSYKKTYICNSKWCKNDAPQNVTYFNETNALGTFTKKPYSNYTVKLYALRQVARASEAFVREYSYIYPGFELPTKAHNVQISNLKNMTLKIEWNIKNNLSAQFIMDLRVTSSTSVSSKNCNTYYLAVFQHPNCTLDLNAFSDSDCNLTVLSIKEVRKKSKNSSATISCLKNDCQIQILSMTNCINGSFLYEQNEHIALVVARANSAWIYILCLFVFLALSIILIWFHRGYITIFFRKYSGAFREYRVALTLHVYKRREVDSDPTNTNQLKDENVSFIPSQDQVIIKTQNETGDVDFCDTTVKVEDLKDYIIQSLLDDKINENQLTKQFFECKMILEYDHHNGDLPHNRAKNRYKFPRTYDHSRVILDNDKQDYINANFIDGYSKKKAYIATQGPLKNTVEDFWYMIFQEKVKLIIMVTSLEENKTEKCCHYWPISLQQAMQFDDLDIRLKEVRHENNLIIREILVCHKGIRRLVTHIQYEDWPDHHVPDDFLSLNPMLTKMTEYKSHSPIVVHCSAGWGRTGTVILCHYAIRMAQDSGRVDFFRILQEIRKQRCNLVNKEQQYTYAHFAVYEFLSNDHDFSLVILSRGYILPRNVVEKKINQLILYLEDRAWQLESTHQFDLSISDESMRKNRFPDKYPGYSRVYLKPQHSDNFSNYIFAMRVENYKNYGEFIVTQQPLKTTIGDFWRLVDEKQAKMIISLNELDDPTSCVFWPKGNTKLKTTNNIEISRVKEINRHEYTEIHLNMNIPKSKNDTETRTVKLITMKEWKSHNIIPDNQENLLTTVGMLIEDANNFPIIVACLNASTASGLFIALYFALKQLNKEGQCDLSHVVRVIRRGIPDGLKTQEEILYLLETVDSYLQNKAKQSQLK